MKKVFLIFLVFLNFGVYSQVNQHLTQDTTDFGTGGGHITINLMLVKETKTFTYMYRDDLWINVIEGVYEIKDDSIFLQCKTNCENTKGSNLGPIVIESEIANSTQDFSFAFRSTAEDTVSNFTGRLIVNPNARKPLCGKSIEILHKDSVIYTQKLKDCNTNNALIYIPFEILEPNLVSFTNKTGIFIGSTIKFNELIFERARTIPVTTNKKRRKKKK